MGLGDGLAQLVFILSWALTAKMLTGCVREARAGLRGLVPCGAPTPLLPASCCQNTADFPGALPVGGQPGPAATRGPRVRGEDG